MHLWLSRTLLPSLESPRILHVAPERPVQKLLKAAGEYISLDLSLEDVDLRADIAAVPLPDGSIDLVVASHVLEHVDDDHAALREIHRLLSPSGIALLLVPWDPARPSTFEDATVTDPADRERLFGQWDHVRLYGGDLPARIARSGFDVERIEALDVYEPTIAATCGLVVADGASQDVIWLARRTG